LRMIKEKPHYSVKASPVCANCLRSYTAVHRALQLLRGGRADWARRYEAKVAQDKVAEARRALVATVDAALSRAKPVEEKFNYKSKHRHSPGGKSDRGGSAKGRAARSPTSPTGIKPVELDGHWDLGDRVLAGHRDAGLARARTFAAGECKSLSRPADRETDHAKRVAAVMQGRVSMKMKSAAVRAKGSIMKYGVHPEQKLERSRSELRSAIDLMDDGRQMDLADKVLLDVLGSSEAPPCYYRGAEAAEGIRRSRRQSERAPRLSSAPAGRRGGSRSASIVHASIPAGASVTISG